MGGLTGLLQGVGHALQPDDAVVHRNRPQGHVTDGEDGAVRSAGRLVHDHAARPARLAVKTGFAREVVIGEGTDADEDGVGRQPLAVGQTHRAVLEGGDLDLDAEVDPRRPVTFGEEGRERL